MTELYQNTKYIIALWLGSLVALIGRYFWRISVGCLVVVLIGAAFFLGREVGEAGYKGKATRILCK